ncbi:hemolysin family protein [Symmachiella dynata]|uniref:hemolysin family protein n=1 Tax=Symmachiella dynata TaxID=2527995 RepID=UPI0030EE1E19
MWGVELIIVLCMIAVNGIFAGYEIALASVSLSRLQVLLQDKRAGAKAAFYMKENMESSLATVQLGITLVGAIAAATGGAGAAETFAPQLRETFQISVVAAEFLAITAVVVPLTVATIIFGELIPKVFAIRNKEWVCLRMSNAIKWFSWSVWPVVRFLEMAVNWLMKLGQRHWQSKIDDQVSTESPELQELHASATLARWSRQIGAQEEKIIHGATALSQRLVRDIMLPAGSISMLDVNASISDCLVAAHLDMHTRFPVTERTDDPQAIIGYVNFKDIVAHMRLSPNDRSLRAIVRTITSFEETTPASSCLETIIKDHRHIALVRDEAMHVVGMVTLEDMIEELVGEIEDEYDRLPAHVVPTGSGWVVGGGITLIHLEELTKIDLANDLPQQGARSLNEWIIGHLGRAVQGGETLARGQVRVVVRKVRRQKVLEAQIEISTANQVEA